MFFLVCCHFTNQTEFKSFRVDTPIHLNTISELTKAVLTLIYQSPYYSKTLHLSMHLHPMYA